jgi:hypothetical protein
MSYGVKVSGLVVTGLVLLGACSRGATSTERPHVGYPNSIVVLGHSGATR